MPTEFPEASEQETRPGRVAPFWEENQPTVLIAASDAETPSDLLAYCARKGIRTHIAETGAGALIAYGRMRPDAVVLDELLPGIPARDVAAAIAADGPTPVFIVPTEIQDQDQDRGQDQDQRPDRPGSHQSYAQVISSTVLKRLADRSHSPWPSDEELTYGTLVMRPSAFEVHDNGNIVALTLREFELLRVLMLAGGQAVTLEQLKSEVWGVVDESVRTETVKVHMNRLRKKLTGSVRPTAVRGVGYVLKIH